MKKIYSLYTVGIALVLVSGILLSNPPIVLAATIVSDDFNDNSIDTAKWDPNNLLTSSTDTNVSIAENAHSLKIGPLLQNVNGISYRGLRTVNSYNFNDAFAYIELVQAPASNTTADAMFSVGSDFNNCYRMYVSGGNLIGLIRHSFGRGAIETTLFTIPYDTTNHRFLRIRNDLGNLYMETAPGTGGVPGTWTQQYSELWNSLVVTSAIVFEIRAGTSQVQASPPGKVTFDNFLAATP